MEQKMLNLARIGLLYFVLLMACSSNTFMTHYSKGIEQHYYGKLEESLISYNNAIKLNPNCAKCYLMRAKVYEELGDVFEALESYDMAISIDPDQPAFYNNRGKLRMSQAVDRQWAIDDFTKAIELDPANASIYYHERGVAHLLNQNQKMAEGDFRKSDDLKKKDETE
jgi:tetratricopeptide (TPR) repeat protein